MFTHKDKTLNQRLMPKLAKRGLLAIAPVLVTSAIGTAPALGATFAFSEASAFLDGFSHNPYYASTFVKTRTLTTTLYGSNWNSTTHDSSVVSIDPGTGSVFAQSLADALFLTDFSAFGYNNALSQAGGTGSEYRGIAQSEAKLMGNFFVNPTETFSFNFDAFFDLFAAIDNPKSERSTASANISFLLFGSSEPDFTHSSILDYFSVSGHLDTGSYQEEMPFYFEKSDSFHLYDSNAFAIYDQPGLNYEEGSLFVTGGFQRSFDRPMHLSLVEVKNTEVTVKAPEPSSILALLVLGGVMGPIFGSRRQAIKK
ncbi:hypothetical protein [Oscillatoria acuminata]|uniref:Ice-binding protein C-terminal domain-containing protein n=1 Tax=Oscillatoria acuminata PCC 6304 TaxID=56110 RepID=K9TCY0_9CYAN|nr:hypothetical protein [Oscillatoria acuminata]AFY79849.1 hypothetical protein Oscil6304_0091 [Oscillatoria acuminata PCC 6304]